MRGFGLDGIFLSPFLRPYLKDGVVILDNAVTEAQVSLDPLQRAVAEALWDADSAETALADLAGRFGLDALKDTMLGLGDDAVLFASPEECEATLDWMLESRFPEVPFLDHVELTTRCPMRCRFCARGRPGGLDRPCGDMPVALLENLLDQIPPRQRPARAVELNNFGESLLHPQVEACVSAARDRGFRVRLSVNACLLDPGLCRRLLGAGVGQWVISLDGMDEPTLAAIRGPAASFARAEENLEFLAVELAGRTDPVEVVVQMLELRRNLHQRQAFLARWGDRPPLRVFLKPLDGPDPDTGEIGPNAPYLCLAPWRSVVVLWDGRVVPCCLDASARCVLGDASRQSLATIWNGPEVRRLREMHRSGRLPDGHLCERCDWRRQRFARTLDLRHPRRARPNPLVW
jgi:radical SAM protein with 4Fe4S-binding SPASM domain